ncbi:MAG TPA: outer membrane beta-barrel protein [Longimicrobium sp.]|nr:outer membrane beta-barrel protein [Longimicrobium sp.]
MFTRRLSACAATAALALLFGGPASAQSVGSTRPGTVEIGGFGQWTWFDENAGRVNVVPEDGFGYGGRLGIFVLPRVQLEADGWFSPQDRDLDESFCCTGEQPTGVDASAFALRLNYNFPFATLLGQQSQLVLGLGAVRTNYAFTGGTAEESSVNSFGASGLAGLRIGIANHVALRLDGVADYMPDAEPSANTNLHARAGLSLLFGGARPAMVEAAPLPEPPSAPPLPAQPDVPTMPSMRAITVCVIDGGMPRNVEAMYNVATGDSTVDGRPFRQAFAATAPTYAAGAPWYLGGEPITALNRRYVKYGLPRVLGVGEVTRVAEYQGTPLFAEPGTARPDVVYVAVRPGCEFQPYQSEVKSSSVRGE